MIRGPGRARNPAMTNRISTLTLLAYAAPKAPLAALYFPVFVYLAPFYAEERGISLETLGIIFIAARLLDAVTDPVMGALSDRWRTRFGRRRLWLAVSAPLVCASVWMAMVPPRRSAPAMLRFGSAH